MQPQYMSGLMNLHGNTTPEEKRRREDKQKQYARELDEQVLHLPVHSRRGTQGPIGFACLPLPFSVFKLHRCLHAATTEVTTMPQQRC